MRFLPLLLALALLLFALPTAGFAMGSGPHPTVVGGIPFTPTHGARFIMAETVGPDMAAPAPSLWDHPIYVIALGIAGGELLLGCLMLAGKATRGDEE
jgi:hypothetical protein